jgi:hypothetical protein
MRITTTVAFNKYLMDNSTIFPYNKLRATRNSFYCKWILLQGEDRGSTEFFPVLATSIPNELLLKLISSESAKPLTPELSGIMDTMYWWGKNKSLVWYEDVIDIVAEAVDMDTEYDRKELFRAMISGQVRDEIHKYFPINSVGAELLWLNWISWFNVTYSIAPQSFMAMSRYSFEYVSWSIAQVNYHAFAPATFQANNSNVPDSVDSA